MRLEDIAITVVGLGVVGGSFAEGLKKAGAGKVYGIDNNLETLKKAKKSGIVDEAFENGKIPLPETDLVIISLYPELLETFILENNEYFKKNSIITDVTGIKGKVLREVKPKLRKDIDFILVPAVGLDKKGYRLGMGGGYYDRYLVKAINAKKIAAVYDCQLVDEVIKDDYDIKVDMILTENTTIKYR